MYSMHCAFARAVLPYCYYTYWCTVPVGCTCTATPVGGAHSRINS